MAVTTFQQGSVLPLPRNIPTKTVCIELDIPDDPDFFRLFYGALDALSNWFAYDRDHAKTGRLVAALWRKVIRSIRPCPGPGVTLVCGDCGDCGDCEGCMTVGFRQQGCLFQKFDCLTGLWVTVYDGSLCVTNPAPGGGTTPPGPGLCQTYNVFPKANALTPLPFLVNTGDTITVTSEMGAGSDGTLNWYCPDGNLFIAGVCAGGGSPLGTDPVPTINHMALILRIGSSYYPLPVGVFTVPSGIVNASAYVQVNDSSLTDDTGEYTVALNYCNNQTPPVGSWCYKLDFTLSPQGFSAVQLGDGAGGFDPLATWVAGQGWVAVHKLQNSIPQYQWGFMIVRDLGLTSTLPWTIELKGHTPSVVGAGGALTSGVIDSPATSSLYGTFVNSPTLAANVPFDYTVSLSGTNKRYLYFLSADYALASIPSPEFTLASVEIHGTGPNPFGSSNC